MDKSQLRTDIRTWSMRAAVTFVLFIAGTLVGSFITAWGTERGWFDQPSAKVAAVIVFLTAILHSGWFQWSAGIVIGFAIGVRLDLWLKPKEAIKNDPQYRDTRLRLRLDPSGSGHLVQVASANIHSWRQTVGVISTDDGNGNVSKHQHDTLVIAFEGPLPHSRPIIESFGHRLPMYNYFPLGDRGAIFQFSMDEMPQTFEVWFPSPDYYDGSPPLAAEVQIAPEPLGAPPADLSPAGRPWIHLPGKEKDEACATLRTLDGIIADMENGIHTRLRWTGNAPQKLPSCIGEAPANLIDLLEARDAIEQFRSDNIYDLRNVQLEMKILEVLGAAQNAVAPLHELVTHLKELGDDIPANVWPLLQKAVREVCRENGNFGNALTNFRNEIRQTRESIAP